MSQLVPVDDAELPTLEVKHALVAWLLFGINQPYRLTRSMCIVRKYQYKCQTLDAFLFGDGSLEDDAAVVAAPAAAGVGERALG